MLFVLVLVVVVVFLNSVAVRLCCSSRWKALSLLQLTVALFKLYEVHYRPFPDCLLSFGDLNMVLLIRGYWVLMLDKALAFY